MWSEIIKLLLLVLFGWTIAPSAQPPPTEASPTQTLPAQPTPIERVQKPEWDKVQSFAVQLSNMPQRLDEIAQSKIDVVVIAHKSKYGRVWNRDEVLRAAANKQLFAYLSVGSASKNDWYWQPWWKIGKPDWLVDEDENSFGYSTEVYPLNHPSWVKILQQSIDRYIKQGFDGVFVDVLDVYWNKGYPEGPSQQNQIRAVDLMCQLADHVRVQKPNFKILVNNAQQLLEKFPRYANCFDAIVGESVWFHSDLKNPDKMLRQDNPQPAERSDWYVKVLQEHLQAGKKVFVVDKAIIPKNIQFVYENSRANKFIPYTSNGDLSLPIPAKPPY